MKPRAPERRGISPSFAPGLPPWEARAVETIGRVAEYWGFQANAGRIWALLYLRGQPLTSTEVGAALGLGRNTVSALVRELEGWGVLSRVRLWGSGAWKSQAETDLVRLVRGVVSRREAPFVAGLRARLHEAERAAVDVASPQAVERLQRLRSLAEISERALIAFVATPRFDISSIWKMVGGRRFSLGGLRRVLAER